MLQTFLRRRQNKRPHYFLNFYCKVLCATTKHCQLTSDEPHSALFSCSAQQGISQFLFLGFLSLSPCHCGGSCQYPTQPTSLVQSICFLHACVLFKAISQTSVYKHADLHSCKRRLNLHMCSYLRFETSR